LGGKLVQPCGQPIITSSGALLPDQVHSYHVCLVSLWLSEAAALQELCTACKHQPVLSAPFCHAWKDKLTPSNTSLLYDLTVLLLCV
jgi:hypothetical protein